MRDLPPNQPYRLRVLYLEDPRLPTLPSAARTELLAKLERLLTEWFRYDVTLREVGRRDLAAYFTAQAATFTRQATRIGRIDFDPATPAGRRQLHETIAQDFRPRALEQLERYLGVAPIASKAEAVAIATERFLARLQSYREITLGDGSRAFDPHRPELISYAHWAVLLEEITEADLVLTNTMIAGADVEMPLYVIARGGLTTALTDNNVRSPLQGATMVGLFPFLSDAPVLQRERGPIPADELLDVIATMCLHELGHLLLRYAEHFDHPGCVHVAPTGLDYLQWHRAVRAHGPCTLPHRKTPRF